MIFVRSIALSLLPMQDAAGPARDQQAFLGPSSQTLHRLVKWTHISGVAECRHPSAAHLTGALPCKFIMLQMNLEHIPMILRHRA